MRTALYDQHLVLGGKMLNFCNWDLPLSYGSQIDEHHAVRSKVGIFDVSHMTVIDVKGQDAFLFLRKIIANDVAKLNLGQALYACMLKEDGGVIDDLIVYKVDDSFFRLVLNASTHDKDLAWLKKQAADFHLSISEMDEKCIIALQGPDSLNLISSIFPEVNQLKPFHFFIKGDYFIARTGYTGEKGLEIIAPVSASLSLWKKCIELGALPCGLGARDTLRLEAGLNLYGHDMDEGTSPFISNLAWTLVLSDDRDFIGKAALMTEKSNPLNLGLVGLILKDKGVLRTGQTVFLKDGRKGIITSGGFSPTLEKGIALARLPLPLASAWVEIRGHLKEVMVVKPSFVRNGKSIIELLVKDEVE